MSLTHPTPTADACLRAAQARVDRIDAEHLLLHVLARSAAWLYSHGDDPVSAQDAARYDALVARRAAGEPVAYLTGARGFWTFDVAVTADTLIPRADTERLVELALQRIAPDQPIRVLDLGTGSGVLALAIARERPAAQVAAVDRSEAALQVARGNADALGLSRIAFHHGDWWAPVADGTFDIVVSNPPYIADADPHLQRGDLRHEPRHALAAGPDGLDALRTIVGGAPRHLAGGGWLLVEHGWEQGAPVRALFDDAGFVDVSTVRDLGDRDRVTLGRRA